MIKKAENLDVRNKFEKKKLILLFKFPTMYWWWYRTINSYG